MGLFSKKKAPVASRQPYSIVKNEFDNSAEVNLYGEVVSDRPKDFWTDETDDSLFIVLNEFLNDIDSLNTYDSVTFRINSVGGDCDAGKAIYNRIREMDAETTTVVDGLAASAASVIFMAGDNRKMNVGSQLMVHGASTLLWGYYNAADLKGALDMIKGYDNSLVDIYADRTGNSKESMSRLVQNTTWLSASDAVEKGFADEIVNTTEPVAAKVKGHDDMIIVNGNPLRLPKDMIPELDFARKTISIDKVFTAQGLLDIDITSRKEDNNMTLEVLNEQYPELVEAVKAEALETAQAEKEQAVKDAVEAERERIKGIEDIQDRVSDAELVNKAKYETIMDAKELAFEAMKAEADINAKALEVIDSDADESGADEVEPDPQEGSEEEAQKTEAQASVNLLKAAFQRK